MIRFLHLAGSAVWLGAQMTFMVWGPSSREASLEAWAHTWRTLATVQRVLVAPAAAIATLTGVVLTMQLVQAHAELGGATWLYGMQGLGLLAAFLALAWVTPLASKMGRIAQESLAAGEKRPEAERVRVRLAIVGSISGVLILAAMAFAAMR